MPNVRTHLELGFLAVALTILPQTRLCAEEGYGSVSGRFVLEGEFTPLPPLYKKGANIKDPGICAVKEIPNESLLVDPETKGIANVFFYLDRAPDIHPDLELKDDNEVTSIYKDCRIHPHASIIRVDQMVRVKSEDSIAHNLHTYPTKNFTLNQILTNDGKGIRSSFTKAERIPFPVGCDFHFWIRGYWLVVDHPYAVLTDSQGNFQIEKLPAGTHKFRIWHESAPKLKNPVFEVTIKPGEETKLDSIPLHITEFEVHR